MRGSGTLTPCGRGICGALTSRISRSRTLATWPLERWKIALFRCLLPLKTSMICLSAQGAATLHTCTVRLSLFDVPPAAFPTPTTLSYRVSRLAGCVRRTVKNVAGSFAPGGVVWRSTAARSVGEGGREYAGSGCGGHRRDFGFGLAGGGPTKYRAPGGHPHY